jgi:hypothetical protein
MSFNLLWNGQIVLGSKDGAMQVTSDPLTQERLWDAWCCVDAIVDDDGNYWWLDAEELASFVEENFLTESPIFTPLPDWLRQNATQLQIEVSDSFEPAA